MITIELLASGRDADVYALDDDRVLRRYRNGRPAEDEASVIRAVVDAGFPTPAVHAVDGPDLVLERVTGPTLAEAMLGGTTTAPAVGEILALLHDQLHAVPWAGGALLHLDLHPRNVIVSARGPVVIDWSNARPGPPGLDVAMTALICAQVALVPSMAGASAEAQPLLRASMADLLRSFAATVATPYADGLVDAAALRRRDPNMSATELAAIDEAAELARDIADN